MMTLKTYPSVSVIIPMYNAEAFIHTPIKSLLNQSFKNFEVIIVDDGSVDLSVEKATKAIQNDERFRIIKQSNTGPGEARNQGISIAKGEYISFLDSDDYFDTTFLEKMFDCSMKEKADVVICNFAKVDKNGKVIKKYIHPFYKSITNIIAFEKILQSNHITSVSPNKLFKRELFNNITYPKNIIVNEDVATIYRLILEANKVAFVNESLFFYVYRKGSSINNYNAKKIEDRFIVADMIKSDLIGRNLFDKYIKEYYVYYLLNVVLFGSMQICLHAKEWQVILRKYKQKFNKKTFSVKNILLLRFSHKNKIIPLFLLKINIAMFGFFIRLLK